jgi:hypothetical protein
LLHWQPIQDNRMIQNTCRRRGTLNHHNFHHQSIPESSCSWTIPNLDARDWEHGDACVIEHKENKAWNRNSNMAHDTELETV